MCGFWVSLISLNSFGSVEFGSTTWYESQDASNLSINGSGQLLWIPVHDRTVYVYIGEHNLANVGDSVTFSCLWSSTGDELHGCIDYGCEDEGHCNFDDDVTCLAGTGDFRMGLFGSNGRGVITYDGFETCGENPVFRGYLGYHWRFHPHICQSERFTQQSGESHTNVSCWKRDDPFLSDNCGANLIGDCGGVCPDDKDPRPNSRIYGPQAACFNLGLGEWAPLSIGLEKVSGGLKTTFSFNGQTFTYTDTESSYEPNKIDVFAIHFSNARPYDYVIFDSIEINSTARAEISFNQSTSSASEGEDVSIDVVLTTPEAGQTYTVDYSVIGGTATYGADYSLTPAPGTLTFNPDETTETISIDINNDGIDEDDETVILELSNVSSNAELGTYQQTFTIKDGDQLILLEEFAGTEFSPFNHSSTIAETHNGVLVVAWYGGSSEGADDVSIWVTRNDGNGWSPRIEVCDGGGDATWNPVLFQPSSGPLLLYYKYGGRFDGGWEGSVRLSYDNGQTWSDRIPLPSTSDPYLSAYEGRFVGPTKNRPLELPDGRLLLGSSTEDNGWRVHMEIVGPANDYTTDYELIGPIGGGIQPTFLVHDDNHQTIQAICRSGEMKWSYDGGNSWPDSSALSLTTSAGLHAVTVNNLNSQKNRWHVLAYNINSSRDPLRIAISQDGINWTVAIPTLDGGSRMDYPTIMQTSDKMLHITYSYSNHSKIKHVVIDPYVLLGEARTICEGDFSPDLKVDVNDLKVLAEDWLRRDTTEMRGIAPDENNLILHYAFEGTSGQDITTVPQLSCSGVGALTRFSESSAGDLEYGESNPWTDSGTSADFQNLSSDPGTGLYADHHSVLDLNLGEFTISSFIKPRSTRQSVIIRKRDGGSGEWYLDTRDDGRIGFTAHDDDHVILSSAPVQADNWYHVAGVFDEDAADSKPMKLYINGELSNHGAHTLRPASTSEPLGVGCIIRGSTSNTGQFFDGLIDELEIYDYALSEDEIIYEANHGRVMVCTPLDSPANAVPDDIINLKDFAVLSENWLNKCEP